MSRWVGVSIIFTRHYQSDIPAPAQETPDPHLVDLDPVHPQSASAPQRESSQVALDRQHVLGLEPHHAAGRQELELCQLNSNSEGRNRDYDSLAFSSNWNRYWYWKGIGKGIIFRFTIPDYTNRQKCNSRFMILRNWHSSTRTQGGVTMTQMEPNNRKRHRRSTDKNSEIWTPWVGKRNGGGKGGDIWTPWVGKRTMNGGGHRQRLANSYRYKDKESSYFLPSWFFTEIPDFKPKQNTLKQSYFGRNATVYAEIEPQYFGWNKFILAQ